MKKNICNCYVCICICVSYCVGYCYSKANIAAINRNNKANIAAINRNNKANIAAINRHNKANIAVITTSINSIIRFSTIISCCASCCGPLGRLTIQTW